MINNAYKKPFENTIHEIIFKEICIIYIVFEIIHFEEQLLNNK